MRPTEFNFNRWFVAFVVISLLAVGLVAFATAPERLTDEQFWKLSSDSSEEDGVFRSDNLLSNETTFQYVIPDILKTAKQGRVYLGVGPEQNFTYITALKPSMAVIVDIRHGNLDVHLLYKALFELSKDRAEFVSRLFSRKRPNGLTTESTAAQIFDAFANVEGSKELYDEDLKAVVDVLTNKHHFPLTSGDREGIAWALSNYYQFGPDINYASSLSANTPPPIVGASVVRGRGGNFGATYATLMTAEDGEGQNRSYLANESGFAFLKDLETRNMIVPVVGDFGGTKAIRAVGRYLKSIDAMVSAFYVSNVEQFLFQGSTWDNFCQSVSLLPIDNSSVFIRSGRGGPNTRSSTGSGVQNSSTAAILPEIAPCSAAR